MALGESMISTLKSNKRIRLDKSKHFRKTLGGYTKTKRLATDLPKATPNELKVIREHLTKQNRQVLLKSVVLSIVICLGFVLLIIL